MTSDIANTGRRLRAVLQPTDFSASSELAFVHALKIAIAGRTKFYMLHAAAAKNEDEVDWSAFPGVRRTLAGWGLLPENSVPAAVVKDLGVQLVKIQIPDRNAVRAILSFLQDHPSDLIVLSTQGREGLPRWLHGSVAEPVARDAYTPTLFIPEGTRGFVIPETGEVRLRRVLLPIDRRPRPEAALELVQTLARVLGVDDVALHLLYVGDADAMPAVDVQPGAAGAVDKQVRSGNVVEQIMAAAGELDVDLIAMATAGREGFLDALRGSTTERVLRQAPCPVLAVPAA